MPASPPTTLQEALPDAEHEAGEKALGAWVGFTYARDPAMFVLFPNQCRVVWSRKGQQVWGRDDVLISASADGRTNVILIEPSSGKATKFFVTTRDAVDEVNVALGQQRDQSLPTVLEAVGSDRVVTLPSLPGHRIEQVHGVVSGIASLSGWTAATKGRGALDRAFPELLTSAARRGANAVVGVGDHIRCGRRHHEHVGRRRRGRPTARNGGNRCTRSPADMAASHLKGAAAQVPTVPGPSTLDP